MAIRLVDFRQEADLEIQASARPQVAGPHVPNQVDPGDIPRRPIRACPSQPLRRVPVHDAPDGGGVGNLLLPASARTGGGPCPNHSAVPGHVRGIFQGEGSDPARTVLRGGLRGTGARSTRTNGKDLRATSLPDFAVVRSDMEQYVRSLAGYQKNVYPDLPVEVESEVSQEWRRCFEEWGYPVGGRR